MQPAFRRLFVAPSGSLSAKLRSAVSVIAVTRVYWEVTVMDGWDSQVVSLLGNRYVMGLTDEFSSCPMQVGMTSPTVGGMTEPAPLLSRLRLLSVVAQRH